MGLHQSSSAPPSLGLTTLHPIPPPIIVSLVNVADALHVPSIVHVGSGSFSNMPGNSPKDQHEGGLGFDSEPTKMELGFLSRRCSGGGVPSVLDTFTGEGGSPEETFKRGWEGVNTRGIPWVTRAYAPFKGEVDRFDIVFSYYR